MSNARYLHTASVLTNGKVLVTGGYNSGGYLNSSELYDPSTGVWATTGSMTYARDFHTCLSKVFNHIKRRELYL
jgi:hypothetical protein